MKCVGYTTPDYKRKKNHCPVLFSWHSTKSTLEEPVDGIIQGGSDPALLWEGQTPVLRDFHPAWTCLGDAAIVACRSCILSIWAASGLSVLERRHFASCPFASVSQSTAYIDAEQTSLHSMLESLDTRKSSITEELATGNMWNVTFWKVCLH